MCLGFFDSFIFVFFRPFGACFVALFSDLYFASARLLSLLLLYLKAMTCFGIAKCASKYVNYRKSAKDFWVFRCVSFKIHMPHILIL